MRSHRLRALGKIAAGEAAVLVAEAGREGGRILLADHSEHAFSVRFAGEEAEAQAMPRAAVFDARDLVKLVIVETGNVSSGSRHRCDRGAQVDDEQLAAAAILSNDGRLRAFGLDIDFAGVVFHVHFPNPHHRQACGRTPGARIHFGWGGARLCFRAHSRRFRYYFIGETVAADVAAPWQPRCLRK